MINWKTTVGLLLFIASAIELLTVNDLYRTGKIDSMVLVIGASSFLVIVTLGIILFIKGLKRNKSG